MKGEVAVVVGEVEARHGGGGRSAADLEVRIMALLVMTSIQYPLTNPQESVY